MHDHNNNTLHAICRLCAQALASIVFLRLHPKPLRHTPSYEFTTSFGGVCWGLVVGMSRQHLIYTHNSPGRFAQIIQSRAGVIALLQRVSLGEVPGMLYATILFRKFCEEIVDTTWTPAVACTAYRVFKRRIQKRCLRL